MLQLDCIVDQRPKPFCSQHCSVSSKRNTSQNVSSHAISVTRQCDFRSGWESERSRNYHALSFLISSKRVATQHCGLQDWRIRLTCNYKPLQVAEAQLRGACPGAALTTCCHWYPDRLGPHLKLHVLLNPQPAMFLQAMDSGCHRATLWRACVRLQ